MILLTFIFSLVAHPFHVSVSEIKYKSEEKAIQISTRIFLDDFEKALKTYTGNERFDITQKSEWEQISEVVGSYLLSHVTLWDGRKRPYELKYVGAEMEGDVMWCYLEVEKVRKLSEVEVSNRILHEVWEDQENLVHFRAFGGVQSARLYRGEDRYVFSWEE